MLVAAGQSSPDDHQLGCVDAYMRATVRRAQPITGRLVWRGPSNVTPDHAGPPRHETLQRSAHPRQRWEEGNIFRTRGLFWPAISVSHQTEHLTCYKPGRCRWRRQSAMVLQGLDRRHMTHGVREMSSAIPAFYPEAVHRPQVRSAFVLAACSRSFRARKVAMQVWPRGFNRELRLPDYRQMKRREMS